MNYIILTFELARKLFWGQRTRVRHRTTFFSLSFITFRSCQFLMSPKDYYLLYCGGLQYYYLESSEFYCFFECVFLTPKGHKFHDFSVARFTTLDGCQSFLPADIIIYYFIQVILKFTSDRDICCHFWYHKKLLQR